MDNSLATLSSSQLRSCRVEDLDAVAAKLRHFLIQSISRTGGHIGANLGVVELTLALHYVFESPEDKLIFDTGHQGYVHKLITGRVALFPSLNTWGGMSRFVAREESIHDIIDASHAGTSISLAAGMAWAMREQGARNKVVAVIGDGSMVEGMAAEAMNYAAGSDLPLIVVINDNEMAIAPSVGGFRNLTTGENWAVKSRAYFEGLGFEYMPVPDGHNPAQLVEAFRTARRSSKAVVVHVKTEKGRGLDCADGHPYRMHFSMPFDPSTGRGASPTVAGKTIALAASEELSRIMQGDKDVVVLTPATPYASYLDALIKTYPDRVIDVGMAEQHAVGMAVGLGLVRKKPVLCIQTTFMQRAYDQLVHDVCYMNVPVTILGVRSGFAGYDSHTHHGIFDIPYLRSFPNLQVYYPLDSRDMQRLLAERLANPRGPMVILHPYEPIVEPELGPLSGTDDDVHLLAEGQDGIIITLGNCAREALALKAQLADRDVDFGVAVIRQIKPSPIGGILRVCGTVDRIITIEENVLAGGVGSLVAEVAADNGEKKVMLRCGVADEFIRPGTKEECAREAGIDVGTIMNRVAMRWPELFSVPTSVGVPRAEPRG